MVIRDIFLLIKYYISRCRVTHVFPVVSLTPLFLILFKGTAEYFENDATYCKVGLYVNHKLYTFPLKYLCWLQNLN